MTVGVELLMTHLFVLKEKEEMFFAAYLIYIIQILVLNAHECKVKHQPLSIHGKNKLV